MNTFVITKAKKKRMETQTILVPMGMNKQQLDSGYTLKVEQRAFIDGLQWNGREGSPDDPKIIDLGNWKDGGNSNLDKKYSTVLSVVESSFRRKDRQFSLEHAVFEKTLGHLSGCVRQAIQICNIRFWREVYVPHLNLGVVKMKTVSC